MISRLLEFLVCGYMVFFELLIVFIVAFIIDFIVYMIFSVKLHNFIFKI